MKFTIKELKIILSLIGILFLLIGCSKNINQKSTDENEITATVIEDSKENCRLANASDCRPIEIKRGEPDKEEVNITNKTIKSQEENFTLSDCQDGWKCVEKNYRAYQFSNCSWVSIEHCVFECNNGTCKPAPICKPKSLKCDKDNLLICNADGYDWKLNESCDYKCENSVCISKNVTMTNSTNTSQFHDFILDKCMSVLNFNYAPAGNNLSNEYFTLKNSCPYQIDMSSWTAKDNSTHVFTFPVFNLDVNSQITIVTGTGVNNSATLYWGKNSAVWNNNGDILYLNTSNGTSVLIYSYP